MGQYWKAVNLDKKEYLDAHQLGAGLKLWEQLAAHPGTSTALIILQAAMPEDRGGGDLDIEGRTLKNPEEYVKIARRTIGRWVGDRVVLVGDYAEDSDIQNSPIPASKIYRLCRDPEDSDEGSEELFKNITLDVCRVIEHELNGKFKGIGWRDFIYNKD